MNKPQPHENQSLTYILYFKYTLFALKNLNYDKKIGVFFTIFLKCGKMQYLTRMYLYFNNEITEIFL